MVKTRYWHGEDTSTAVQFRTDASPKVWMHTNIGWIGASNAPGEAKEAEVFAEELAEGYGLKEADQERARYMLGLEEDNHDDD